MKNIPKDIKKFLIRQEHNLTVQKLETETTKNIVKRITSKIKRDEDDLLLKNIDEFRVKKEVKDILENNKNIYDKYGTKGW